MSSSTRRLTRRKMSAPLPGEWRQIAWSGYTWSVRPTMDAAAPGPNAWSDSTSNAWVDSATGELHLEITQQAGVFRCVQLDGTAHGYGTYRWVITSLSEPFGEYPVLGLFTYDFASGNLANGYREIDIELTHWGSLAESSLVWYTVQPGEPLTRGDHGVSGNYPYTCEFTWQPGQVYYKTTDATGRVLGENITRKLVQSPMTEVAVMNLWLMDGHAPPDGANVAATLRSFEFIAGTTYTLGPAASRRTSFSQYPDGFALKSGAAIVAGALELPNTSGYSGAYSGYMYDIAGSSVDVRIDAVPQVGNGSNEATWWLRYDTDNYIGMFVTGGDLYCRSVQAGVRTESTVPYVTAAMRYWRIREQSGMLYYDTSPDRINWTLRWSVVHALGTMLDMMQCRFECGHWASETITTPMRIGAINQA